MTQPPDLVPTAPGVASTYRALPTTVRPPKPRKLLYLLVAVLVAASLVAVGVFAPGALRSKAEGVSPRGPSVYGSGTEPANNSSASNNSSGHGAGQPWLIQPVWNWSIPAGDYGFIGLVNLTGRSWNLSGSFTSSHGVGVFILMWAQYQAWGAIGLPSTYIWSAGVNATSVSCDVELTPAVYAFVIVNFYSDAAATIDITTAVIATPTG